MRLMVGDRAVPVERPTTQRTAEAPFRIRALMRTTMTHARVVDIGAEVVGTSGNTGLTRFGG